MFTPYSELLCHPYMDSKTRLLRTVPLCQLRAALIPIYGFIDRPTFWNVCLHIYNWTLRYTSVPIYAISKASLIRQMLSFPYMDWKTHPSHIHVNRLLDMLTQSSDLHNTCPFWKISRAHQNSQNMDLLEFIYIRQAHNYMNELIWMKIWLDFCPYMDKMSLYGL